MVTENWYWESSVGRSALLCFDGQYVVMTGSLDGKTYLMTKTTPEMAHKLFRHWSQSAEPQDHLGVFIHDET